LDIIITFVRLSTIFLSEEVVSRDFYRRDLM
jgi:hypothetical protein